MPATIVVWFTLQIYIEHLQYNRKSKNENDPIKYEALVYSCISCCLNSKQPIN